MAASADFNSPSLIQYSTGLVDDMSLYPGLCITSSMLDLDLHKPMGAHNNERFSPPLPLLETGDFYWNTEVRRTITKHGLLVQDYLTETVRHCICNMFMLTWIVLHKI